jgi:ABC-type bacteriocin/lantibiotic exporters, contain an N-terminal double-glycine peptidase domain
MRIAPRSGLLIPLFLLAACEPNQIETAPTAPAVSATGELAPGAYMLGRRSTMNDLAFTPSLIEIRRRPDDPASAIAPPAAQSGRLAPVGARRAITGNGFSSFIEFQRFATETDQWWIATGDSAYFRDFSVAVVQSIYAPTDGDTWTVQATLPDGSIFDFQSVTFHSDYYGAYNCFVVSGTSNMACGVTGIELYTTKKIQCGQTGKWKFRMSYNGTQYDERELKVVASVDERYVPTMSQGDATWRDELYAHACPRTYVDARGKTHHDSVVCPDTAANHYTIHGKGCAITSAAMVMGYHAATGNPSDLNAWLRDNTGYRKASTDFFKAARFGELNGADNLSYDPSYRDVSDVATLRGLICKYGPVEIAVKDTSHFVVAYGYDESRQTVMIHDPAGGLRTTLRDNPAYNNHFAGVRLMIGREHTDTIFAGMTVTFHSPVQGYLTDPLGRRTGIDPRSSASYADIPASYADSSFSDNDDVPSQAHDDAVKELHVSGPLAGVYTVTVIGTDSGAYSVHFATSSAVPGQYASQWVEDVPTSLGEVHTYRFSYDPSSSSPIIDVGGGFSGGGQRSDVDDLLTYIAPTERQTTLPAGTSMARVVIIYGAGVAPLTFHATLDGTDVSAWFHPAAGRRETVDIPLSPGRNVLKLSIDGVAGSRTATDQDQLVFIVK